MTGIIHATIACLPSDIEAALASFGLWLPVDGRLANPVTVSGVGGAQIGSGETVYTVAPTYDAAGDLTNTPEIDPRRLYTLRVDNRREPRHPESTYDAIIAAATPGDPATFGTRLRALGIGQVWGDPEGDPDALVEPPQGVGNAVSLPSLVFRLWAVAGVYSVDPVIGPCRTFAGVSLIVVPE